MKKVLEVAWDLNVVKGYIKASIVNQSHLGTEFGDGGKDYFIASNRIKLLSRQYPQADEASNKVFVQGQTKEDGNIEIIFYSMPFLSRFLQAVKEYNEFNFLPTVKENKVKEVLKDAGLNIHKHILGARQEQDAYITQLFSCTTEEEFLRVKGMLLRSILKSIPLIAQHCPYCRTYNNNEEGECQNCPYEKEHGNCYQEGSSYANLCSSRDNLLIAISKYVFSPEPKEKEELK